MKTKILISAFLILMLISIGTSFAKGKEEAKVTTIQFASWMVAEESGGEVWIPERIKAWEATHPGVKVEIVPVAWEDTPNKITLQIQGGNAPDIFTIESLWIGKFAGLQNGVEDLNSRMDSAMKSGLVDAYKGGIANNKTAALLWNPNPWVLVVNKELAKKAGVNGKPATVEEFLAQAEAISKLGDDIYGLGLQLGIDEYAADTLHILLWAMGADVLNDKGEPVINSAKAVAMTKLLKDLVKRKVVPFGEEVRNLRTLFAQGKIGFFFEGPWIAGVLDGEGMSRDAWFVTPFPGTVTPASHLLCLSAQSKNKDLAWDLMKFIVTDETTTKEYFKRTGLMPAVKAQYSDQQYNSEYAKAFLTQMSKIKNPNVWSSTKKYEIEIALMEEIQKILLDQAAADAGLNELNNKIKTIIAQ